MAKKVLVQIKLQIPAGKANPAPPVGPALGQHGVQIQDFCSKFNAKTKDMGDTIVPVIVTIYEDRSFTFVTKLPPVAAMIKKKLSLEKGSGKPNTEKVGKLTKVQLGEIAKEKLADLNTNDIPAAMKIVAGTARSMGIDVEN